MKKKIVLKIDANFGSEFQKDSAMDALACLFKAWTMFYERSHKKNKIKWELTEEKP